MFPRFPPPPPRLSTAETLTFPDFLRGEIGRLFDDFLTLSARAEVSLIEEAEAEEFVVVAAVIAATLNERVPGFAVTKLGLRFRLLRCELRSGEEANAFVLSPFFDLHGEPAFLGTALFFPGGAKDLGQMKTFSRFVSAIEGGGGGNSKSGLERHDIFPNLLF